jgi:hypothetical protein
MYAVENKGSVWMRTRVRAAFVLTIVAGLLLLFGLTTTRGVSQDLGEASCHDIRRLFVDGATRISSLFTFKFVAPQDIWPGLVLQMENLAQERGWSYQNTSNSRPGVVETLEVSLCAPGQPIIRINEQRWANRDRLLQRAGLPLTPESDALINISLYGDVPEAVWQPVAADLVAMLEAQWPDGVKFIDENSAPTDRRPGFLHPKQ